MANYQKKLSKIAKELPEEVTFNTIIITHILSQDLSSFFYFYLFKIKCINDFHNVCADIEESTDNWKDCVTSIRRILYKQSRIYTHLYGLGFTTQPEEEKKYKNEKQYKEMKKRFEAVIKRRWKVEDYDENKTWVVKGRKPKGPIFFVYISAGEIF